MCPFLNSSSSFLYYSPFSNPYWPAVSFIGRLFRHALEDSRPKSVLVNLLLVCISLLDPKRFTSGVYYVYNRMPHAATGVTANPETVQGMLESLGMVIWDSLTCYLTLKVNSWLLKFLFLIKKKKWIKIVWQIQFVWCLKIHVLLTKLLYIYCVLLST